MPLVYRIENNNGRGPYVDNPDKDMFSIISGNVSIDRPLPRDDSGINRNPYDEELCGFLNETQAKTWFNEYELNFLKNKRL
jgi:hypothetical protein